MNLRSIYLTCIKYKNDIKMLQAQNTTVNGRSVKHVTGWAECRNALMELEKVPALTSECEDVIKAVPSIFQPLDEFDVSSEEWGKIKSERDYVFRTVADIEDLCEKLGIEDNLSQPGVDVKLPFYNDFSEFVSYVNDLEFVLTKCPFLQSTEQKIEFKNVDVGSTWLTFVIAGAAIVTGSALINNLTAFVDKAIIVRSHHLTVEKQKLDLEHQKYTQAEKEAILKYITDSHKTLVELTIKELEELTQHPIENRDGDEILRIEQCMDRMGTLIEKGLQIHASIDSPPETKALFSPLEMKYLEIEKKTQLLETKKESNDEE